MQPREGAVYIDATFGGGGYSRALLAAADCRVVGIDRDPDAAIRGRQLQREEPRFLMCEGPFSQVRSLLGAHNLQRVDGIVMDLGVSSYQLDDPERGFSFRFDGPLDMRMSSGGRSAADLVAEAPEQELADIFYRLGEEPESRRLAKAIVDRRAQQPFERTSDLANLIARTKRRHKPGRDPATATFQAIRMAINDELGELERGLEEGVEVLAPGGVLVVIAFHSLEDRLFKRFGDRLGGRVERPSRHLPPLIEGEAKRKLAWRSRRVVKPTAEEVGRNPRARSARMRVAIRLDDDETSTSDRACWGLAA